MILQNGDLILTRQVSGFRFISDVLCWWQNSKVASHVGVVIDADNLNVFDARMFQKSKIRKIEYFFNGKYDIRILRYSPTLINIQQKNITKFLIDHLRVGYDNKSIISIISNNNIEDKNKLNCAESALLAYHNAGLLLKRDIKYILPHTFWEYYAAGRFVLVKHFHKPKKENMKDLLY